MQKTISCVAGASQTQCLSIFQNRALATIFFFYCKKTEVLGWKRACDVTDGLLGVNETAKLFTIRKLIVN